MVFKSKKAFSVLECLWGIAVISIVYVLTAGMFDTGNRLVEASQRGSIDKDKALAVMTGVGRQIRDCTQIVCSGSTATFKIMVKDPATGSEEEVDMMFDLVTDAYGKKYLRETRFGTGGYERVLTYDITALNFAKDVSTAYEKIVVTWVTSLAARRSIFTRRNSVPGT
ncbi:hypothetical protein ACFL96_06435 [Thermoproteota archaeon]